MASTPDPRAIHDAVRLRYREVARGAQGRFQYATGREGALALGYDPALIAAAPPAMLDAFCGVGNPLALGPAGKGERLLDVGCGAGLDLFAAAGAVGPGGRLFGIDLTAEMAVAAEAALAQACLTNFEIIVGAVESLPLPGGTLDLVISNGALNLSPDKESAFREIHRVLRPGGRLQVADIVLDEALPAEMIGNLEAWSG